MDQRLHWMPASKLSFQPSHGFQQLHFHTELKHPKLFSLLLKVWVVSIRVYNLCTYVCAVVIADFLYSDTLQAYLLGVCRE